MADDQLTRELRECLGLYLEKQGIDPNPRRKFCCLNPAHEDTTPSMSYYPKKNIVHCFACGASYSVFDLIGIDYGLRDFKDQKAKAMEIFMPTRSAAGTDRPDPKQKQPKKPMSRTEDFLTLNNQKGTFMKQKPEPPTADFSAKYEEWHAAVKQTKYWESRGITQETIEKYKLGFDPDRNAVVIPCGPHYYVARNTTQDGPRYMNPAGIPVKLFNEAALDQTAAPVWITEGAIDALSILQCGKLALAMNSCAMTNLLIDAAYERKELPPLIICTDQDRAGDTAADRLMLDLAAKTPMRREVWSRDANAILKIDGASSLMHRLSEGETALIEEQQTKQQADLDELKRSAFTTHLKMFIQKARPAVEIRTGFDELDQLLDGGLHEGLHVLGAMSSAGKTTFALQIANQAARAGELVIFFSLEQSINELLAKSVSMKSKALMFYDVMKCAADQIRDRDSMLIDYCQACDQIAVYGDNLHVIEDARDVRAMSEAVFRISALTGRTPLVIIDYLQAIDPPTQAQDRRAGIDMNVTELKRLAVNRVCPVLVISSLNRTSYNTDISETAFKESGGIEYSSDLLIGLQYAAAASGPYEADIEKAKTPREMQIKIVKARNGRAGDRLNYSFNAAFNRFTPELKGPEFTT